jgi:hypothetical protein
VKSFISVRVVVASAPALVLLAAGALVACSSGSGSSSPTVGTGPRTPAGSAATVAPGAQVTPTTYRSKAFVLPLDVTPPTWQPTPPSVEQRNFVTWEAADGTRAVPIDGVWTASWTRDELVRSPLTEPGEVNDENCGQCSLTFNRGRVIEAVKNRLATYSGSGSFRLDGDTFVYDRDNGEHFVMRWTIKGNQLTLKRDVSLGVGPTPFVIKPWVRRP